MIIIMIIIIIIPVASVYLGESVLKTTLVIYGTSIEIIEFAKKSKEINLKISLLRHERKIVIVIVIVN